MAEQQFAEQIFEKDNIHVVNINHGVRKESIKDKELIEKYCKKN
ncbi:MAG: hypothetical protein DSY35_00430, partial [Desulfurobacterium sp.]